MLSLSLWETLITKCFMVCWTLPSQIMSMRYTPRFMNCGNMSAINQIHSDGHKILSSPKLQRICGKYIGVLCSENELCGEWERTIWIGSSLHYYALGMLRLLNF